MGQVDGKYPTDERAAGRTGKTLYTNFYNDNLGSAGTNQPVFGVYKPLCDYSNVGRTKLSHLDVENMRIPEDWKQEFRHLQKNENMVKRRLAGCPEVFDKLSVNWDGKVAAYCRDYDNELIVGNLTEETLQGIFWGEEMQKIREILSKEDYDKLPLCTGIVISI